MERILIVDDDPNNLDVLDQELRDAGYETRLSAGGKDGLAAVREGGMDLVLLDIMMPEVSGVETLCRLREEYSMADLPVIMVTAKDQSQDVVESLSLGANDYVSKPIDIPVLLARVRTQLSLRRLMRQKDDFVRIASHDLKSPLMSILSYAGLLLKRLPEGMAQGDEARRFISRIHANAMEMGRLIEDLLDFQVLEDGTLALSSAPVDLNELAGQIVEGNVEVARAKQIQLGFEPSPGLPPVEADEWRLNQVIENLVGNAIKYCPPGGQATVRAFALDGAVGLEVSDTGPGLSDEDLKKAFVRYARLSNLPTGGEKSYGIGLAI
ncbi:MAG: response regulator, partial [Candidatus Sumerlaeota bacterium]|nr:response regulator [Candidatus Sumerlaeota bacterium]